MEDSKREGGARQKVDPRGDVVTEKVRNVWGSVAGAGSDFFHLYRKHRTVEMDRIKAMEEEHDAEREAKVFEERKRARAVAEAEKGRKRSEKRKRRKVNKERNGELRDKGSAINAFAKDGSFLETIAGEGETPRGASDVVEGESNSDGGESSDEAGDKNSSATTTQGKESEEVADKERADPRANAEKEEEPGEGGSNKLRWVGHTSIVDLGDLG